jgi:folate-binding protein YgfZ
MAPLVVHLPERSLIGVSGPDARPFLQGIITADINRLEIDAATYGALLSPQGKILFDFFLTREGSDRYLIDCPHAQSEALMKRLQLYKLRANIVIAPDPERQVTAVLEGHVPGAVKDPRPAAMGERLYAAKAPAGETAAAYHERRISLGFAEGGSDFASGELFPHEANLDQIGGVSFEKGCFIGQEVVSRIQHRGTARSRVLPARSQGTLPARGSEIRAGDTVIGRVLSGTGQDLLALLRLDRLADSTTRGLTISAEGVTLEVRKPSWASFEIAAGEIQPT